MESYPSNLEKGCLLALRYFGIFRYPLKLEEIHMFNPSKASLEETRSALDALLAEGIVYQKGHFFLPEKDEDRVPAREKANEKACQLLAKTGKFGSIIATFPFVRGIAISGSLSKFSASANSDIDYFIITEADRLWIARTMLHLFKKLTFLTGHQHFFCMNYFIDTKSLTISHPNLYSAIEAATLLPLYNAPLFVQFDKENEWIREYLPNHPGLVNFTYVLEDKKHRVKKALESMAGFLFPDRLNHFLMRITDRKWRRKWKRAGYPEDEYDRAFMTSLHISKNHPVDYEKKVLTSLVEDQNSGR